jgi:hypothetical protein
VLDQTIVTIGIGLLASLVAGKALVHGVELLPLGPVQDQNGRLLTMK